VAVTQVIKMLLLTDNHINKAFSSKVFSFTHSTIVWCPYQRKTPCDINVVYTPLERTFNRLQFHRWQYRSIYAV